MQRSVYEAETENESTHWWFVGRRDMLSRRMSRAGIKQDALVLDVGTSTGTNIRMLRDSNFTRVIGLEIDAFAVQQVRQKLQCPMIQGSCITLPLRTSSVELVLATDVIEHVIHDNQAVSELHRVLTTGGHALVTVPAFMSLWGLQDDLSHHQRRYRKHELEKLLVGAGFDVQRIWYFNAFLFLPILLVRRLLKVFRISARSEGDLNTPGLNRILRRIFSVDCWLSERLQFPFGVSIAAHCRKI